MTFEKWFTTFLDEKDVQKVSWEIEDGTGTLHFISSDVVIEHVMMTVGDEQAAIKDMLVKIDFANGDVNHFFKHLANALVQRW